MTTYSTFLPGTNFNGVRGDAVAATRNFNWGSWTAIPIGSDLQIGDIVQYEGSSFMVGFAHTKTSTTATPPSNSDYTLLASVGSNGVSYYTWFAYADSADGTVNFTTGIGGERAYLGIASNKTTLIESQTPSDYVWKRIQGSSGKVLYMASDRQLITYDTNGVLSPTPQTTTINVYPSGLSTGTFTLSMTTATGTVINANTYLAVGTGTFTASGNNITWNNGQNFSITGSNFNTARGTSEGVIIKISHADNVTDSLSIVRAPAGVAGASAESLYLTSDRQLISYDSTGALNPTTQTIACTIHTKSLPTTTYTISLKRADNTIISANTYLTAVNGTFTASGNNISWSGDGTQFDMTAANFNAAKGTSNGVIINVSHATGISDSITILKQQDGAPGAAGSGSSAVSMSLTASPTTVFEFVDGYPKTANQTITMTFVLQNSTEGVTWTTTPAGVGLNIVGGTQKSMTISQFGNTNTSVVVKVTGNTSGATASVTLTKHNVITNNISPDPNTTSTSNTTDTAWKGNNNVRTDLA